MSPLEGIPFGVGSDGHPKDVDEVQRGLACNCTCPACASKLVARQGEVRIHHFAHHSLNECRHALETSVYAMILELLRGPTPSLYLPGFGYQSTIVARYCSGLDQRDLPRGLIKEWVRPPRRVLLENVRVTAASLPEASPAVPEVQFEVRGARASLHLLNYKKTLEQVRKVAARDQPLLVLSVRSYAAVWWRTCDPARTERIEAASRATDVLADWLENSSEGRGWLCRPDCDGDLQQIIAWAEKNRAIPREIEEKRAAELAGRVARAQARNVPPVRTPAPFPVVSFPAPERPVPPPDVPDKVVTQNVGTCYCGAPVNRVLLGSGLFAGKEVEMCSVNPRHPLKVCGPRNSSSP